MGRRNTRLKVVLVGNGRISTFTVSCALFPKKSNRTKEIVKFCTVILVHSKVMETSSHSPES